MTTHEVFNQSSPLGGHNAAALDLALLEGFGAREAEPTWMTFQPVTDRIVADHRANTLSL